MRHRMGIGVYTGLGNPDKEILSNAGNLEGATKKMVIEAVALYFKKWEGCDYDVTEDEIKIGIEPAYQYEKLKVIAIKRNKGNSYLRTGIAFGGWGSGICSSYRFYSDYKTNGKFKKFVDRWHGKIFNDKRKPIQNTRLA